MKLELKDLSSALLKFHRALLQHQTSLVETADGKKYQPYELLNLSLGDPRYSWLRQFSELIVQIDTIVDDKKDLPFDAAVIASAVGKLIRLDSAPHAKELLFAVKADSSIMIPLAEVRKYLLALEARIQTEKN